MLKKTRDLIARTRSLLLASAMSRAALGWLAASAAAAGLAVGVASALGAFWAGQLLFFALCALAAVSGGLSALARIPSPARAAAFLDAQLKDDELLSAALHCEARGMSGRFDAFVVDRAEEFAAAESTGKGRRLDFGRRRLVRLAAAALASVMAGTLLSFVPRFPAFAPGGRKTRTVAEASALSRSEPRGMRAAAARSVARSVFPGDARLAREAERALGEGRYDDFRSRIEKADADLARRIAKSSSALERDRLEKERQALRESAAKAMDDIAKQNEDGSERNRREDPSQGGEKRGDEGGQGKNPGPGKEGEGGENRKAGAGAGGKAGDDKADPPAPAGRREDGAGGNEVGADSGGGEKEGAEFLQSDGVGDEPGRGSGAEKEFARMDGKEKDGKTLELGGPEPNPIEIVMPGKERKAAPGAAAEAIRSAEAALSRERLPLEYGDYVREYFLSIAENERGEGE